MSENQLTIATSESMNPAQLLTLAVDKDLDIEKLQKLMELQRQWQADQAKSAFFDSLTKFQMECPDIRKTKSVEFGGKAQYKYAPLADIDRQIKDLMHACGLTKRWEIQDDKTDIAVTCIITHIGGHSERTTIRSAPDASGSKNAIQARGSAIEFLKRYTLTSALGITTADEDIDGRMNPKPPETLDKLHADYMEIYNQIIQIDSSQTRLHPDNWKAQPTAKAYVKAVGELRKILFDLQQKKR